MKTKFISLLVYFCLQTAAHAFIPVTCRQAEINDLDNIVEAMRNYTEEDKKVLVNFPQDNDSDRKQVEKILEQGKIFVAEDQNHQMLGFVKLFVIEEERQEVGRYPNHLGILQDELRAIGEARKLILVEQFDSELAQNRKDFLAGAHPPLDHIDQSRDYGFQLNPTQQLLLYYGSAYTLPEARGHEVNSQLLACSLKTLFERDHAHLKKRLEKMPAPKQLILTYGQVDAVANSKGMIQVFTEFAKELAFLERSVLHLGYRAYKPSIEFNHDLQRLKLSFSEEGKGMGSLVILDLQGDRHDTSISQ